MSDDAALRHGYKILTYDWQAPLQGGAPLCDGTLPAILPPVTLDTSPDACGRGGYHYAATLHEAAMIAGWWRTGRPARCVVVTAAPDAIARGTKRRSSSLTLDRLCTDAEIQGAMRALVSPWAGDHVDLLTAEQWAWYVALGRPVHDAGRVGAELQRALKARQSPWSLKRYATTETAKARKARDAWTSGEPWDAWTGGEAWEAWEAWTGGEAREARKAWDARDTWDAWDAREAREAWTGGEARDADISLLIETAVRLQWYAGCPHDQYTLGIREAYRHGLALALPTGPQELGWVMDPTP